MSKFSRPLPNALPKTSGRSHLLPIAAVILATTVCLGLAARVLPERDYDIPYSNWFVTFIPESWNNIVSKHVTPTEYRSRPAAQTSSTQSAPVIPERPVVSIDVSTPRSITKPD